MNFKSSYIRCNVGLLALPCVAASLFLIVNLLYYFKACESGLFLGTFSVLSAVSILALIVSRLQWFSRYSLTVFGVCYFVLGLAFCFVFSPGSAPDEAYHYFNSYFYADLILGNQTDTGSLLIEMRRSDADFVDHAFNRFANFDSLQYALSLIGSEQNHSELVMHAVPDGSLDYSNSPFYIKAPTVIAIIVCRALNLDAAITFYIGRISNFVFLWLLTCLAIRICPFAKGILIMVCLLPMTLHLGASFSYDAGIIGLGMLSIATLISIWNHGCNNQRAFGFFVLLALLAPCKAIYSLVLIMFLLVPRVKFSNSKLCIVLKICAIAIVVIGVAVSKMTALLDTAASAGAVSSSVPGSVSDYYTLGDILADPVHSVWLLCNTFSVYGDFYLTSIIGGSLSAFQESIIAPNWVIVCYVVLLIASTIRSRSDDWIVSPVIRIGALSVSMLVWLAATLAMWLGWTHSGNPVIEGVQGRYILPVLPLLLLSWRSSKLYYEGDIYRIVFPLIIILNVYYLMRTCALLLM